MRPMPETPRALSAALRGACGACGMAVALLGAGPVRAADAEGAFTVLSVGTRGCDRYVEAYAERAWDKLLHSAWVAGYLTALNQHVSPRANISATMNAASRDRWLLDFCQRHAQSTIAEAAAALATELARRAP